MEKQNKPLRLKPEFAHLHRPEYSEAGNAPLADQEIKPLSEVKKQFKTEDRERRERQHNREFYRNLKAQFLAAKIARFERTPDGRLIAWFPQTLLLQGPNLANIWGFISVLSVENAFATETECRDYINRLSEQMRQETGNVITLRAAPYELHQTETRINSPGK